MVAHTRSNFKAKLLRPTPPFQFVSLRVYKASMRVLVLGHRGWLAGPLIEHLRRDGMDVVTTPDRLASAAACAEVVAKYAATVDRVVCCIGRTHGGSVGSIDYLEDNPAVNLRDNCKVPLALALACVSHNLHLTYLGTGCIFMSTPEDPPVAVDAAPTFHRSAYSRVKGVLDELLHQEPLASAVLNVRIRMPFVSGGFSPRNFHSKVFAYRHNLASVANSVTVVDTLLPFLVGDIRRGRVGTVNLTNPGFVTHEDVLNAVEEQLPPERQPLARTLVPHQQVEAGLKSQRSNTILESSYPMALSALNAVRLCCASTPVAEDVTPVAKDVPPVAPP